MYDSIYKLQAGILLSRCHVTFLTTLCWAHCNKHLVDLACVRWILSDKVCGLIYWIVSRAIVQLILLNVHPDNVNTPPNLNTHSWNNVSLCLQDNPEDITTIDSCEYIWEAGVGFAHSPHSSPGFDQHRMEILKLIMTCFSETMYLPPVGTYGAL